MKIQVGDRVAYRPDDTDVPTEFGVVTSMTHPYVFVRFDDQPKDAHAKACRPRYLSPIPKVP
jgi:hypothetical protein